MVLKQGTNQQNLAELLLMLLLVLLLLWALDLIYSRSQTHVPWDWDQNLAGLLGLEEEQEVVRNLVSSVQTWVDSVKTSQRKWVNIRLTWPRIKTKFNIKKKKIITKIGESMVDVANNRSQFSRNIHCNLQENKRINTRLRVKNQSNFNKKSLQITHTQMHIRLSFDSWLSEGSIEPAS